MKLNVLHRSRVEANKILNKYRFDLTVSTLSVLNKRYFLYVIFYKGRER